MNPLCPVKLTDSNESQNNEENERLLNLIAEPSKIKRMRTLPLSSETLNSYAKLLIYEPFHDLTQYTHIMPGWPSIFLVELENGLTYKVAITKRTNINWPGGMMDVVDSQVKNNMPFPTSIVSGSKTIPIKPTLLLDSDHYVIAINPIHSDGKIYNNDTWIIGYPPEKRRLKKQSFFPWGPVFSKFPYSRAFDRVIKDMGVNIPDEFEGVIYRYPQHLIDIFFRVQDEYDKELQQGKVGKPIYTEMSFKESPIGWAHAYSQKAHRNFPAIDPKYVFPEVAILPRDFHNLNLPNSESPSNDMAEIVKIVEDRNRPLQKKRTSLPLILPVLLRQGREK